MADSVLDGYNGTVMAYGQTGAGKTYTTTGGDTYETRGLAPRLVQYFFQHKAVKSHGAEVSISYLEVYNEQLFDLLVRAGEESAPLSDPNPYPNPNPNPNWRNLPRSLSQKRRTLTPQMDKTPSR